MRPSSGASEPGALATLRRDNGWAGPVAAALIFGGFVFYGAMRPQTALAFTMLWGLLASACLVAPRMGDAGLRIRPLRWPAAFFAATVLMALWSLTSYAPGGPHPVWAYLQLTPGAVTINKSSTVTEVLKLLGLGCAFLVGLAVGSSDSRARLSVNVLLGLGVAYGAWAFFTFVLDRGPGQSRLEASFLSANTAATVFASLLVLTAGPLARKLRGTERGRWADAAPYGVAALTFLGCLLMTASRGGFVAALAGLLTFAALQVFAGRAKLSRAALVVAAGGIAILTLLALGGDFLITRLLGASKDIADRAGIFKLHWAAFQDAPWLGYGLGTFDDLNRALLNPGNFDRVWNIRSAHNIYLSWLEQAGILGSAAMFATVGAVVLFTVRAGSRRSRMTSVVFALVAVDVVFLVHGLTDFALEMFSVAALWSVLLGLQFSLAAGSVRR